MRNFYSQSKESVLYRTHSVIKIKMMIFQQSLLNISEHPSYSQKLYSVLNVLETLHNVLCKLRHYS